VVVELGWQLPGERDVGPGQLRHPIRPALGHDRRLNSVQSPQLLIRASTEPDPAHVEAG